MRREGKREMPSKRRTTMKRMTAVAFLAATLISMTAARAHAQAGIVEAKVPFGFNVGDRVLPAGAYRISYVAEGAILIRSLDGRFQAATVTHGADDLPTGEGMLVFKRYGNRYFLHEVLCNIVDMNLALPKSKLEKRMSIEEAQLARSQTVAALQAGER
jgi:hypothetical protein